MKKINKEVFIGLLMTFIFTVSLFSTTTGAIEGYVTNAQTGDVISQAKITIVSAKSEAMRYELYSDKKGHFYKGGLVPGFYNITVEKEGYLPVSDSVRVSLGDTPVMAIKLESVESLVPQSVKTLDQGMKLIDAGKYDEAIEKFTNAISADQSNPVYYYYRGVSFEKSGNIDKALEDYQKSIELKPNFILSISRTGNLYAKKKDFEKAIEFYKKAIEAGEQDITTYYNYGVCLLNLGNGEEARNVFEKLLSMDANYSDAYYRLGIIYIGLGDPAKAKECLQKFIEMDPENTNAEIAREILKSLS